MEKKMNKFIKILLISSVTCSLFSGPNEDLFRAARTGNSAGVEAAIAAGADINAVDADNNTALMIALARSYADIARLLLDRGSDVFHKNKCGETVLNRAASSGFIDIVQFILDRGANVNQATCFGYTPLMGAVVRNHADIVRLLLDRGADINYANNYEGTALTLAREWGNNEIVKMLEKYIAGEIIGDLSVHKSESKPMEIKLRKQIQKLEPITQIGKISLHL